MRKFLLTIILCFLFGCGSHNLTNIGNFEPSDLFYKECIDPQFTIDSICKADSLNIEETNFTKWNKIENFTSDSVIQKTYFFYNDSVNVSISVTENKDNKYIVKMIK